MRAIAYHHIKYIVCICALLVVARVVWYYEFFVLTGKLSFHDYAMGFCQWDCGWYSGLANWGYESEPHAHGRGDAANWAFFPVFPNLVRIVHSIVGARAEIAGFIVSNIFSVISLLIASFALGLRRRHCLVFCVLFICGPYSFYFASPLTEATFFMLSLSVLAFLGQRRYVCAGIACAILSGTRFVGVFMTLAIFASMVRDHLRSGGKITSFIPWIFGEPRLLLSLALAPFGLFMFMLYLYYHVGDALAFWHIQRAWDRGLENPLVILFSGITSFDFLNVLTGRNSSFWASFVCLIGLSLAAMLLIKKRYPEFIFSMFCLLIPLSTGIWTMPRYIIGTAPILLIASEILSSSTIGYRIIFPLLIVMNLWLVGCWFDGMDFVE